MRSSCIVATLLLACTAAVCDGHTTFASAAIKGVFGCNVTTPPTVPIPPAPGGDSSVVYVPNSGALQVFDANTLALKKTYMINAYRMTPLTATKAVSFEAYGNILQGGGVGANEIDLTTGALSHRGRLALPNDTTLYSTVRLDDDTVLLSYTTKFMGKPTTLSKLTVSTLALTDTVVLGDSGTLGLGNPTYLPTLNSVAFQWTAQSVIVVNLNTMAVKNITLPASIPNYGVTMQTPPAVMGSTLGYLGNDTHQDVLVQVDMSTSPPKLLGTTPLNTPPASENSLYWAAPYAVSGGFLAQYNMWNETMFSFVPAATSSADVPKAATAHYSVPLMAANEGVTVTPNAMYTLFTATLGPWHPKACTASFYNGLIRVASSGLE